MKKNKGFTLIELVAIIVVLVAIFLVAFPILLGTTKKTQKSKTEVNVDILCDAGKTYIYSRESEYPQLSNTGEKILIQVSKLVEYGAVDLDITDTKSDSTLIYTVENDGSLKCEYNPNILIPLVTEDDCMPGLIYNGQEQDLLRKKIPEVVYTNYLQTNAGEYTITALLDPNAELQWQDFSTEARTIVCRIGKAKDNIDVTPTIKIYDNTPLEPDITTDSGVPTDDTFYSDSSCTTPSDAIDVGTYYVIATTAGDTNYDSENSGCTIGGTITPASLTPIAGCEDKVYDATTNVSCTLRVETVMPGDSIEVKNFTCAFSDKNAAQNKTVTCTNITAGDTNPGADRYKNYTLLTNTTTTTATIRKRDVDPPINLNIATTGVITWNPPATPNPPGITNPTGYEISFDNGSSYRDATSGTNYFNDLTGSAGEKRVLIRSKNSDTTNFNTPSAPAEVRTNVYTITVNSTNGTISPSPSVVRIITGTTFSTSGQTISIPQSGGTPVTFTATKQDATGYTTTWDRWSETSGTLTSNKTITAIFTRTPIDYTITYNYNSATTVPNNPTTYTIETASFTLANPARVGYQFKGWSGTGLTGDSNTTVTVGKGSTGNRSYTSNWTPNTYYVRFNKNNSSATGSMSNQTFRYDTAQNLTSNAYSLVGRTFDGWTTNSNGTGTAYTNGQSVSNLTTTNGATVDLYAKWKPNKYYIHYDMKGGTGGPSDQNYDYSETESITLAGPKPEKSGYFFAGWSENSAATTVDYLHQASWSRSKVPSSGDTFTLYAVWIFNPEMTCTVLGSTTNGTGTNSSGKSGYLLPATISCTCDGKGGIPTSITVGSNTYTNTSSSERFTKEFTVNTPGFNIDTVAYCNIAGTSVEGRTGQKNYYRKFYINFHLNGAQKMTLGNNTYTGDYTTESQILASNYTNNSVDPGYQFTAPTAIRESNTATYGRCGSSCAALGWDLNSRTKTPAYATTGVKFHMCYGCTTTANSSTSGTLNLNDKDVYIISYGTMPAPRVYKTSGNYSTTQYISSPILGGLYGPSDQVDRIKVGIGDDYSNPDKEYKMWNAQTTVDVRVGPMCADYFTDPAQAAIDHVGGSSFKYFDTVIEASTTDEDGYATPHHLDFANYDPNGWNCGTTGQEPPNDGFNIVLFRNYTSNDATRLSATATVTDGSIKVQWGSRQNNSVTPPTRAGYTFGGYFIDADSDGEWDSDEELIYDSNGKAYIGTSSNGYSGTYWMSPTSNPAYAIWHKSGLYIVYAKALWIRKTGRITYVANVPFSACGISVPGAVTMYYENSYQPSLPSYTNTDSNPCGWSFNSWNTASNGSGDRYLLNNIKDANTDPFNITLYGQWTAKTYTATLYYNQTYVMGQDKSATITFASYATVPTMGSSVYTFLGYYTEASGGSQVFTASGTANTNNSTYWTSNGRWKYPYNVKLYAHWQ